MESEGRTGCLVESFSVIEGAARAMQGRDAIPGVVVLGGQQACRIQLKKVCEANCLVEVAKRRLDMQLVVL